MSADGPLRRMTIPRMFSEAPMKGGTCIWCLQAANDTDDEHVIPESMGGPWVLSGRVVCGSCNNRLSHLDRAVSDPFDFLTFHHGISGKKGRLKKVNARGNLVADHDVSGPVIRFNSGSRPVSLPDGRVLAPYGRSPRNVRTKIARNEDGTVVGNMSAPFFSIEPRPGVL